MPDSPASETHPLIACRNWLEVLEEHQDADPADFALRFRDNGDFPAREIADQLHCYPRAESKLGAFHRPGMIYTREALEQSSGFAAAVFRASEWPAAVVTDLTGGLGIDSAAWASAGARVFYCERNTVLAGLARHNHRLQELTDRIKYFSGDAIRWLETHAHTFAGQGSEHGSAPSTAAIGKTTGTPEVPRTGSLIYVDPSRRFSGRRVYALQESDPPVLDHLDLLRSSADRYLIKLSPMVDPAETARLLPDAERLMAISVDGEVKELLADCNPARPARSAVIFESVLLHRDGTVRFRLAGEQTGTPAPEVDAVGTYLFEADPALFKMRLIDALSGRFGLRRVHPEIGYLTGNRTIEDFPGRTYRVDAILPYKPKQVNKWLSGMGMRCVHIHRRGFPLTVDQLYKKLQCRMGDDAHLIATRDYTGSLVILVARAVPQ
ncbi:class I SAM-dependent methyltransferase [Balneolales bacterium ANBcel1]|nr:class I SAM-dependent methyltransferase [Balneolales bacterium ANBcel1]